MASGIAVIGVDVTDVDTSATNAFALNSRAAVDSSTGVKEYIYVQFPASTAFAVGDVVLVNSAGVVAQATTTTTTPGNAAGRRVGVVVTAVASVAAAQFGFVQIYGQGSVRVLANAAATTILNTTATGGALDDDATAGAEVIDGIVLNVANGGATAAVACTINYPFVGRTL
jgi:hypothetical protein